MAIVHCKGTVVLAFDVPDKQNRNHKNRPVVLIEDLLDSDADVVCVAVTGEFSTPLPITAISLPYSSSRSRCCTGLKKECVADCTWTVIVERSDILERWGAVTSINLVNILAHFS